jgi:hypothetical protein
MSMNQTLATARIRARRDRRIGRSRSAARSARGAGRAARWYLLRVHPHLQTKVMKTFRERNISAWLPMHTETRSMSRHNRGYETIIDAAGHAPLISGLIIMPDFELKLGRCWAVDGVIDVLRVGDCVPVLRPQDVEDLRISRRSATRRSRSASANSSSASWCG